MRTKSGMIILVFGPLLPLLPPMMPSSVETEKRVQINTSTWLLINIDDSTNLFTIFDVNLCISNQHVSQISDLLSLEAVEVGLSVGRDINQFLASNLQSLLQLEKITFKTVHLSVSQVVHPCHLPEQQHPWSCQFDFF